MVNGMNENNNLNNVKPILLKIAALIFAYFATNKAISLFKIVVLKQYYFSNSVYFNVLGMHVKTVLYLHVIMLLLDIAVYILPAIGLFFDKKKILQVGIAAWTLMTLWVNRQMFSGHLRVTFGKGYGASLRLDMGRGQFWIIGSIVFFIFSVLLMSIMVLIQSSERENELKFRVSKIWFVPALLRVLYWLSKIAALRAFNIKTNIYTGDKLQIISFVGILWILLFLFLGYALSEKKEQEKEVSEDVESVPNVTSKTTTEGGYISLVSHILLLLFTCGIWLYIWIYRMTGYTNQAKGEEYRNPTSKLLLNMFVPFYSIYWTYKTAIRIDKMAHEKNISSDLSTLCLIMAMFVPIIPPILMQDKVNAICAVHNPVSQPVSAQPQAQPEIQPQVTRPVVDETELLKKYKELLDTGVITQEEFDAKKKQILGL